MKWKMRHRNNIELGLSKTKSRRRFLRVDTVLLIALLILPVCISMRISASYNQEYFRVSTRYESAQQSLNTACGRIQQVAKDADNLV
jgi:hypothetical protein